jgi:hypothetical protein
MAKSVVRAFQIGILAVSYALTASGAEGGILFDSELAASTSAGKALGKWITQDPGSTTLRWISGIEEGEETPCLELETSGSLGLIQPRIAPRAAFAMRVEMGDLASAFTGSSGALWLGARQQDSENGSGFLVTRGGVSFIRRTGRQLPPIGPPDPTTTRLIDVYPYQTYLLVADGATFGLYENGSFVLKQDVPEWHGGWPEIGVFPGSFVRVRTAKLYAYDKAVLPPEKPSAKQKYEEILANEQKRRDEPVLVDGAIRRLCLNGAWQWRPTGFRTSVPSYPPEGEAKEMHVPAWLPNYSGWLSREVEIPREWQGRVFRLHFDAVSFTSRVYINGKQVAEHDEGFMPFEVDITEFVRPGERNTIEVGYLGNIACIDTTMPTLPQGFQGGDLLDKAAIVGPFSMTETHNHFLLTTPEAGGRIPSQTAGGIWGNVYLFSLPAVHILDVFVKPRYTRGEDPKPKCLDLDVTIENSGEQSASIAFKNSVLDNGDTAHVLEDRPLAVPPKTTQAVSVSSPWVNPIPWEPDNPHLYHLVTRVEGAGPPDELRTRFGFREFWVGAEPGEQRYYMLNGHPFQFRSITANRTGAWPVYLPFYARIYIQNMVNRCGINSIRMNGRPFPPEALDVADEMGFVVEDEPVFWASRASRKVWDPLHWERLRTHTKAFALRDRNHPSVALWSIGNELGFLGGCLSKLPPGTQYTRDNLAEELIKLENIFRENDPTRAVTMEHDDYIGERMDFHNIHYPFEHYNAGPFERERIMPNDAYWPERGTRAVGELTFAGDTTESSGLYFKWQHEKPLLLGEVHNFVTDEGVAKDVSPWNAVCAGEDLYRRRSQNWFRTHCAVWFYKLADEAYRYQDVSVSTFEWGEPGGDWLKRVNAPEYAFVKQYDWHFYAGDVVEREVALFNDSSRPHDYTLHWEVRLPEGDVIRQGDEPVHISPGRHRSVMVRFEVPATGGKDRLPFVFAYHMNREGSTTFADRRTYAAFPAPSRVSTTTNLFLYDPAGAAVKIVQLLGLTPEALASLNELEGKTGVLLVGPNGLVDAPEKPIEAVDGFVSKGGVIITLAQTRFPWWYARGLLEEDARAWTSRAFLVAQGHPVMAKLDEEDLWFWRGDHVVVQNGVRKKPDAAFIAYAEVAERDGLSAAGCGEVRYGNGAFIFFQMPMAEKADREPAGPVLLSNALRYADAFDAPVPVGLRAATQQRLGTLLERAGLRSTPWDPRTTRILLTDADEPPPDDLEAWVKKGGTLVIDGLSVSNREAWTKLTPGVEPAAWALPGGTTSNAVGRARSTHILGRAITGVSNADLYWGKGVPVVRNVLKISPDSGFVPLLDEPIALAACEIGKGRVYVNQVDWRGGFDEQAGARKFIGLLLVNLGAAPEASSAPERRASCVITVISAPDVIRLPATEKVRVRMVSDPPNAVKRLSLQLTMRPSVRMDFVQVGDDVYEVETLPFPDRKFQGDVDFLIVPYDAQERVIPRRDEKGNGADLLHVKRRFQ